MMVFIASEIQGEVQQFPRRKTTCQLVKTCGVLAGSGCEHICMIWKWFKTVSPGQAAFLSILLLNMTPSRDQVMYSNDSEGWS